jgi:hypothetical protein
MSVFQPAEVLQCAARADPPIVSGGSVGHFEWERESVGQLAAAL